MRISSIFLTIIFWLITGTTSAQFSKYIVSFKNRNGTTFSISNPGVYLSQRSINRRIKQKILIDSTDLPVTTAYLDSIRSTGVTILNISKWLNQVCIATSDPIALNKINSFSFVNSTQPVRKAIIQTGDMKTPDKYTGLIDPSLRKVQGNYYDYGNSFAQIHLHEGEFLHNAGFHGEGMSIAVIDAGFFHYSTNPAFDSIRLRNQIRETYDFVHNKISVDEENTHGMNCLSILASNIPGKLVGSCPNASYYLYKSEDVDSEYPVEEQNWVAAAERADSFGVDVLSTSLGYNNFDNPIFNHTYQQLNGVTTIIARGNVLAAKKGILSIVAAGNEGNSTWHYIDTPADADQILAVGAVDITGAPASFSSFGPSADGRVKPDVASLGVGTAIAISNNTVSSGNGTSFATPNLAGLATCLWQAFPEFTNLDIIDAIKKSSSIYNTPDNRIGYGIPNFHSAYDILMKKRNAVSPLTGSEWIKIFPNPVHQFLQITINPPLSGSASIKIFDQSGRLLYVDSKNVVAGQLLSVSIDIHYLLARGTYHLQYNDGTNTATLKFISL